MNSIKFVCSRIDNILDLICKHTQIDDIHANYYRENNNLFVNILYGYYKKKIYYGDIFQMRINKYKNPNDFMIKFIKKINIEIYFFISVTDIPKPKRTKLKSSLLLD